jgi:hypothetical protein
MWPSLMRQEWSLFGEMAAKNGDTYLTPQPDFQMSHPRKHEAAAAPFARSHKKSQRMRTAKAKEVVRQGERIASRFQAVCFHTVKSISTEPHTKKQLQSAATSHAIVVFAQHQPFRDYR